MNTRPPQLSLRLFVEVDDLASAQEVADAVTTRIQSYGEIRQCQVQQYWKIPQYYEVFLKLVPDVSQGYRAFDSIMFSLGSGWELSGSPDDRQAVWNPSPLGGFFLPMVRWANLELLFQ